ncbi:MAG: hypothetical protein A3I66_01530 [Burkholderiales bacterium RIFCSPLOWO2_02_FULL_57_36]|nr:MAG: hypothetical protein A3I66_01530 [Burkholderiales bacterium RIFCSPLOWO2_02_FULL_57_36]
MPKNNKPPRKIVQVVPAVGWEVVYKDADGDEDMVDDVAFFGLVEEYGEEGTSIAGEAVNYLVPMMVDGTAISEETAGNFYELRRKK